VGEEQLVRLGHYAKNLDSAHATYVNLTGDVGTEHSYFADDARPRVLSLFRCILNGGVAELNAADTTFKLQYDPRGYYALAP
jgi:hypothetical protein